MFDRGFRSGPGADGPQQTHGAITCWIEQVFDLNR